MYRARLVIGALLALALLLAGCDQKEPPQESDQPPRLQVFPGAAEGLTLNLILYGEDPEGSRVRCEIDFGDGKSEQTDCSQPTRVRHTYPGSASYTIRVQARDAGGNTASESLRVRLPADPRTDCPAPQARTTAAVQGDPAPQGWNEARASRIPGLLLVRPAKTSKLTLAAGVTVMGEPQPGWLLIKTRPGQERPTAQELLAAGEIRYAQPVYRYRLLTTPDDPQFNNQSAQFAMMQLTEGWDWLSYQACRPKVAVVDTGADLDHPDLEANLLPGYDFNENDDTPDDESGHGSMVAGIVGAVTNNGQGVAGSTNNLAWVVPLKVFGSETASSVTIADAIKYATNHRYHLINLSLCLLTDQGDACSSEQDAYIEDALRQAYNAGLIAVAASGNYGHNFVGYPANSKYTIAVGAVGPNGERSSFSNYGDDLDFVAPGENVPSTWYQGDYRQGNGTSFSTPFVTGVLALYLGQHYAAKGTLPSFSQAYTCLANNTNQSTWNKETGYGVPQADQALDPTDGTCYP